MKKNWKQHQVVLLSLALSVVLVAARIIFTGSLGYVFLIWNLFLAWIPYLMSILLRYNKSESKFIKYGLLVSWLIFFPNAPYIITDLFHLKLRPPVPLWYDTVLLFWSAWIGFLLGFLSLWNVEHYLRNKLQSKWVNIIVNLFIVLCAFGIYAGRYLRWNSWYVVTNPGDIAKDVKFIVLNPEDNLRTWGVTFIFSLLLFTCYFTIKKLKQNFIES